MIKHTSRLLILALAMLAKQPVAAQESAKTDAQAELMLVYQRSYGGWPKAFGGQKVDYHKPLSSAQRAEQAEHADDNDATIDNSATSREIVYLVKAYALTKNSRYLEAAKRGIDYLLKAQYGNGGWPQYYPDKHLYRAEVTYNDNAMVNVLNILLDVSRLSGDYAVLGAEYASKAKPAMDKGISCMLKTQVTINGTLTAWAAQYDEKTLVPAKARAFELPSLASAESAGVLRFLMRIAHPSAEVQQAVGSAVAWFDRVKITGYKAEHIDAPDEEGGEDVVLTADAGSIIWARFYDLETMEPQFVGRDGVPKKKLAEIENERRTGYAWYGNWGAKLPAEYAKWKAKNGL